jgi:hypothetical protein
LTSPLFLVLSGSFLSHLASLVWLLLFSLWFVWTACGKPGRAGADSKPWRGYGYALGAGLALGMAFLTRSLTAMAYVAPLIVYSLVQVIRRQPGWPRYLFMALGGGAVAALLPAYQRAVTGDPFLNPYVLWWPYDRLGFGPGIGAMPGGHSPFYAWINLKQDLSHSATDLLGWPGLNWLPLALGLALRPRRWRDWGLLLPFVCLVVVYLFYWIGSPARLWGPRYYFEGFAGLWLVGAVGLLKAWNWAKTRQRWVRPALAGALALMVAINLAANLPSRMGEAHGFYGISRAQLRPIEDADLHHALVIVYAKRWLEYGAMLAGMSPTLDDDVVYARGSDPEMDAAVIAEFPGRVVYYLVSGQLSAAPTSP